MTEQILKELETTEHEGKVYVPSSVVDTFINLIEIDIKRLEDRRDFIKGVRDKFLKHSTLTKGI